MSIRTSTILPQEAGESIPSPDSARIRRKLARALALVTRHRPDLATDPAEVIAWLTAPLEDETPEWRLANLAAGTLAVEYIQRRLWPAIPTAELVAIEPSGHVVRLHLARRPTRYRIEDALNREELRTDARRELLAHTGGLQPGSVPFPCSPELAERARWSGAYRD